MPLSSDELELCWKFVRYDLAASDFEPWLYARPGLEQQLGTELYLAAISTDFGSREQVWKLRCALGALLRRVTPSSCFCLRLRDLDVVDMGGFSAPTPAFGEEREWSGEEVMDTIEPVAERGGAFWWLYAGLCRACEQAWLVGQEERQNDVFCLARLEASALDAILRLGRWPATFDTYEALLELGASRGRGVRFADPLHSSSLGATIEDLARNRPGIHVTEIARLLNLNLDLASVLARVAVERAGVEIRFEDEP